MKSRLKTPEFQPFKIGLGNIELKVSPLGLYTSVNTTQEL